MQVCATLFCNRPSIYCSLRLWTSLTTTQSCIMAHFIIQECFNTESALIRSVELPSHQDPSSLAKHHAKWFLRWISVSIELFITLRDRKPSDPSRFMDTRDVNCMCGNHFSIRNMIVVNECAWRHMRSSRSRSVLDLNRLPMMLCQYDFS